MTCEWFIKCTNESIGIIEHPTLGDVEICRDCYEKGCGMGWPQTYMVPPMAARRFKAVRS